MQPYNGVSGVSGRAVSGAEGVETGTRTSLGGPVFSVSVREYTSPPLTVCGLAVRNQELCAPGCVMY